MAVQKAISANDVHVAGFDVVQLGGDKYRIDSSNPLITTTVPNATTPYNYAWTDGSHPYMSTTVNPYIH